MRLFRIGGSARAEALEDAEPALTLEDARREEVLDRIRTFFVENRLEVTANNMLAAHAAFSGLSPRLARKFELMRAENRQVTQEWLNEAMADDRGEDDDGDSAKDLMKRLNKGLERFTAATSNARGGRSRHRRR